jgi:hypothetical protein
VVCPLCGTSLELSRASRTVAALCGVVGAGVAVHVVSILSAKGTWALTVLGAVLGYGIASALVLYFLADLVVQPKTLAAHFPQTHK